MLAAVDTECPGDISTADVSQYLSDVRSIVEVYEAFLTTVTSVLLFITDKGVHVSLLSSVELLLEDGTSVSSPIKSSLGEKDIGLTLSLFLSLAVLIARNPEQPVTLFGVGRKLILSSSLSNVKFSFGVFNMPEIMLASVVKSISSGNAGKLEALQSA